MAVLNLLGVVHSNLWLVTVEKPKSIVGDLLMNPGNDNHNGHGLLTYGSPPVIQYGHVILQQS